jgi:Protein of unknown function (DUF3060)
MLSKNSTWASIVAVALGAAAMLPTAALSKARVDGSHQSRTLDCAGDSARIAGSRNKVTLNGGCTALTIYGSRNSVIADFAPGSSIWFFGSKNEVTWKSADGKPPKIHRVGFGNVLKPGR